MLSPVQSSATRGTKKDSWCQGGGKTRTTDKEEVRGFVPQGRKKRDAGKTASYRLNFRKHVSEVEIVSNLFFEQLASSLPLVLGNKFPV